MYIAYISKDVNYDMCHRSRQDRRSAGALRANGNRARFEHLLLPVIVMGIALILVAFVPLAFYSHTHG